MGSHSSPRVALLLIGLNACLAFALPASAQEAQGSATVATAREQALLRVRGLAARILEMKDDTARVRGLGLLGEYTCKEDSALAHDFFEKAVELARPMQREAADEAAAVPLTRNLRGLGSRSKNSQAWESLVLRIGRCAADYAYALGLQKDKDEEIRRYPVSDLRLAAQLAKENPEKAFEFAQRAVRERVTEDMLRGLPFFLQNLRERSPERADAIFLTALQALAAELRADGVRLLLLGNYLFGVAANPDGTAPLYTMGYTSVGNAAVPSIMAPRVGMSPELARVYLEACLDILARPSADPLQKQVDYAAAFQMRHQSQRFAPNLVQLFDGLMQRLTSQVPPDVPQTAVDRLEHGFKREGPQTLEEYEKEPNPARRRMARTGLFRQEIMRGEFENARRLARDTDDKAEAEDLLALVSFHEALKKLEQGEIDKARELIETQKDPARRALLLAGAAVSKKQRGEPGAAIQLLFSAQREVMRTEVRARAVLLLSISGLLAELEPRAGLLALEQGVMAFNESGDAGGESVQITTSLAEPGASRARMGAYVYASYGGLSQRLQVGNSQVMSLPLKVKGLEDFDFTPSLMKKLPIADEQAESILASLKDEWRRAGALAALAAAYLNRLPAPQQP